MMIFKGTLFLLVQCIALSMLCALSWVMVSAPNKVTRVEYDVTPHVDSHMMQLGKVTFYFENEPIVNYIPSREKKQNMVFFFPQATIPKDIHASLMRACSTQKNSCFTMNCEKVKKPIEGVRLEIIFDTAKVAMDKKNARSLQLEPGVVFNFYNKSLLDKIKGQPKSILNISYETTGMCLYRIKA